MPQVAGVAYVSDRFQALRVALSDGGDLTVPFTDWSADEGLRRVMETARGWEGAHWVGVTWDDVLRTGLFAVAAPVRVAGTFRGVVFSVDSIEALSAFPSRLTGDIGNNVFILYDRDKVLAHWSLAGG